jgi:two-component sensor histidine kinase
MINNRSSAERAVVPRSRPRDGRRRSSALRSDGEDLSLLLREVNHRVRNLLAMIETVIDETHAMSVEEYRARVMARISGISDFSQVIGRADGQKIGLGQVLAQTIARHDAAVGRIRSCGPDVDVGRRLALMLHLVLYELITNAIKYGALSSRSGSVDVNWEVREMGTLQTLDITWTEQGGPEVTQPQRRGFGSRLIIRALREYGQVYLDFDRTGVACYMRIDLDHEGSAVG